MNVGDRFNRLVFLRRLPGLKDEFRCDCGLVKLIRRSHVKDGVTVSCGCVKQKHSVELGKTYGRLTVLSTEYVRIGGAKRVPCRCSCGTERLIRIDSLANGTQSCGCITKEQIASLSLKHGGEGTRLYGTWRSMLNRCNRSSAHGFHRYGGRGICVCTEWLSDFAVFREWALTNGYASGLEIDRIDVDGNYEPSNCRWLNDQDQANNRSTNVMLTIYGESKSMKDWARDDRCVVTYSTFRQRITRRGWDAEVALTTRNKK